MSESWVIYIHCKTESGAKRNKEKAVCCRNFYPSINPSPSLSLETLAVTSCVLSRRKLPLSCSVITPSNARESCKMWLICNIVSIHLLIPVSSAMYFRWLCSVEGLGCWYCKYCAVLINNQPQEVHGAPILVTYYINFSLEFSFKWTQNNPNLSKDPALTKRATVAHPFTTARIALGRNEIPELPCNQPKYRNVRHTEGLFWYSCI